MECYGEGDGDGDSEGEGDCEGIRVYMYKYVSKYLGNINRLGAQVSTGVAHQLSALGDGVVGEVLELEALSGVGAGVMHVRAVLGDVPLVPIGQLEVQTGVVHASLGEGVG